MDLVFYALASYLLGSIPVGLLVGKAKGIDLRQHGSCNIGATNAIRVLGKPIGLLVFLADFLKGALPVTLAVNLIRYPAPQSLAEGELNQDLLIFENLLSPVLITGQTQAQLSIVIIAFCAILGHNFTIWLKFKGGKGIATSAGVLLGLMPVGVAMLIGIWVIILLLTRYVSLASILAAASLPLLTLYGSYHHGKLADGTWNKPLFVFSVIIAAMAIWKHRSNIQRLLAGTENRAFKPKRPDTHV